MPLRIAISDPGFAESFDALVNARGEADADVSADVKAIIQDVRDHGDEALLRLTSKFDQHDLEQTGWRVDKTESAAALEGL
ncbi:MAG: histidinol dehydrogenase, partial [Marinomonas sp.]